MPIDYRQRLVNRHLGARYTCHRCHKAGMSWRGLVRHLSSSHHIHARQAKGIITTKKIPIARD